VPITTLTSREFNQHISNAKRAAKSGPVFITDRGRPTHVLLSFEDYHKLTGGQATLTEAFAQADSPDFGFDVPRAGGLFRPADLS